MKNFELPKLSYDFDALEPYIDARTMELHYSKHHTAYTNNLNNALNALELDFKNIEELMASISGYSDAIRNNGGGYYNHNLYWSTISPNGGGEPSGKLKEQLVKDFGSFEAFKTEFEKAAMTRFGSGWAWLIKQGSKLVVSSTPNQDNPLMDVAEIKGQPILGLDVWEHAYYLNYQNRRNEYVSAYWNIVNWEEANKRFVV